MHRFSSFTSAIVLAVACLTATTSCGSVDAASEETPERLMTALELSLQLGRDRDAQAARVNALVEKILAHPQSSDDDKMFARQAQVVVMYQRARVGGNQRQEYDALVASLAKADPKGTVTALARGFQIALDHVESDQPGASAAKELIEYARAYPEQPFGIELFQLTARKMQYQGADQALALVDQGLELYGELPQAVALRDLKRQLELIGKPLPVKGPALSGDEFQLASLKDKVVLVEFWETNCVACMAELPKVKAVYDKHHDSGFEVVGISLDREPETVTSWAKANDVPWTQIVFREPEQSGWDNPLALQFGVSSLPGLFLVGADGKVQAVDVRGDELEAAVARLLAEKKQKSAAPQGS